MRALLENETWEVVTIPQGAFLSRCYLSSINQMGPSKDIKLDWLQGDLTKNMGLITLRSLCRLLR